MATQAAPRSPAEATPSRQVDTVRRTTHIEMSWDGPWLELRGAARDLRTTGQGGRVLEEASLRADVDPGRRLARLELAPGRPDAQALVGSIVGGGFRAQVAAALPDEDGSTVGLLLDDLPGATLISGYVSVRKDAHAGRPPGASVPVEALDRMSDVCSGWRAGGTAMSSVGGGEGIPMQDCPLAPDLAHGAGGRDELAWHPMGALAPNTMRRRRRIDVGGTRVVEVDAMFRDSYGEPDGSEVVLHEYGLRATLSAWPELEVRAIEAKPAVLPFWECPLAADNVDDLVGCPIGSFRSAVKERLTGTRSCTHLNDMLRVLADVAYLARREEPAG